MSAQIIFLNSPYTPNEETLKVLSTMQETIHFTRVQYFYEIRNDSYRMQIARVHNLRLMYRARWRIIDENGEREIFTRGSGPS